MEGERLIAEANGPLLYSIRLKAVFSVALLLCLFVVGCANTCIVGFSNPPNATVGVVVSNPPPPCPLPVSKSSTNVVVHLVRSCESCSPSNRIERVFLALEGIALHSQSSPMGAWSEWQELFPGWESHPRPVDLVKPISGGLASESLGASAPIPTGIYDQIRVRFVSSRSDDPPVANACGELGWNCLVMADGRIHPLLFNPGAAELRISSEKLSGGLLFTPSDSDGELLIELAPVWSITASWDEGVRFHPFLTGSARVSTTEN